MIIKENERKRNVKGSEKRSQNEIRDKHKAEIEGCNCLIRVSKRTHCDFSHRDSPVPVPVHTTTL